MTAQHDVLSRLGIRVREERQRLGYSQEQLAHLAGLDRTYMSDIERGTRNIGIKNLVEVASALGCHPADLLMPAEGAPMAAMAPHGYRFTDRFQINPGFGVHSAHVLSAIQSTGIVLSALPISLYTTVDLKTQSGIVGAVFAAELATQIGAIPNPIEKGHPDIVPLAAAEATEAELRNYPEGLEIKSTLGNVTKGSGLSAGHERIRSLSGVTWQAHHRDVRALMGLIWDFVGGTKSSLAHPAITGVFYSDILEEEDWGEISGTTGRNTKVTGMRVSGRAKMLRGAIAVIDDPRYATRYASSLGGLNFGSLTQRVAGREER